MNVCVCVCVQIYVYVCVCVCMYVCVCVCEYIYIYIYNLKSQEDVTYIHTTAASDLWAGGAGSVGRSHTVNAVDAAW